MLEAWYDSPPEVLKWQQQKNLLQTTGLYSDRGPKSLSVPSSVASGKSRWRVHDGHAQNKSFSKASKFGSSIAIANPRWGYSRGTCRDCSRAFDQVIICMQNPCCFRLEPTKLPLMVDGSYTNWYDAMWLRNLPELFNFWLIQIW